MDQVRAILKILWEQRFWVLCVVGTIVVAACWQVASADLDARFAKRQKEIKAQFAAMKTLSQQPDYPNDKVNQGELEQAKRERDHVLKLWKELYEGQRSKVLFWPKVLGAKFGEYIDGLKFGDPILSDMRRLYWNYIGKRFDGLLEIVQAKKLEEKASSGGPNRFGGGFNNLGPAGGVGGASGGLAEEDDDYLVQWLDQDKLRGKLQFSSMPSAIQIWVTQEDLWVYETLLRVIANTNKRRGATRPDNAAVRAIAALEVGSAAAKENQKAGKIIMPVSADEVSDAGMAGAAEPSIGAGLADGSPDNRAAVLASRYIDAEGKPYPGDAENFGVEYRQLPVRMVLMMEQRWIPQILVECANAALPIEVKQLRINPQKSGAGFGDARAQRDTSTRGLEKFLADPTLAEVEVRGVVYIYNEPGKEQLLIPGEDSGQLADASSGALQR